MKNTITLLSLIEKTNAYNSSSHDNRTPEREARNTFVSSILNVTKRNSIYY